MDEIVFDLETCRDFARGGDGDVFRNLGVSVVGAFSYKEDAFLTFLENELFEFERRLAEAERVIGYNIRRFDYRVLQPHMKALKLQNLTTLDLMEEPALALGYRPRLDDLARATLGEGKSGDGRKAIEWYEAGKFEELKKYCLDDVRLTRDLLEFGMRNGCVYTFANLAGELKKIPVGWKKLESVPVPQNSLFG